VPALQDLLAVSMLDSCDGPYAIDHGSLGSLSAEGARSFWSTIVHATRSACTSLERVEHRAQVRG
jgi:hypothetical protein